MNNFIYKTNYDTFIPTTKTVEQDYVNGKRGDQLWMQCTKGIALGNYWTLKEIESVGGRIDPILTEQFR